MRKMIALLLLLGILSSVLLLLAGAEWLTPEEQKRTYLREMVYSFGVNQTYTERVKELMADLEKMDKDAAKTWKEVLAYWDYANTTLKVNSQLPKDLPKDDSLCIVVLGYQLAGDGSIQPELRERLRTAKQAAEQYPNAWILCTGGGPYDITEAEQMAAWLIDNGIDSKRIIQENRSATTDENASLSIKLLRSKYPEVKSLVIVSSDYHIPWGAVLFQTASILTSKDPENPDFSVVSNLAAKTENSNLSTWQYQRIGIMLIAGLI